VRVHADAQNAGMNLLGATPIEDADMTKFRDTLMINVMGSVLVSGLPAPFVLLFLRD
jgi:hypothetical protein